MAMIDDLVALSQQLHFNVVLPVPPLCRQILDRAQAEGISFGKVYIVSRPLTPGVRGGYDRETREIWCHLDSSAGEEGQRHLVQCLLTLLSSLHQERALPTTIEDDWYQLRLAHEGGFALAQAWGLEAFFSSEDRERLQERDRYHYRCHLAAGTLAGHPDPFVARNAYGALCEVRRQQGWSEQHFEEVLCETGEDAAAADLVTGFDRALLRQRWLVTHTRAAGEQASFGEVAVDVPQAGTQLRSALEQVFWHRLTGEATREPTLLSARQHHWFARVATDRHLVDVITLLNTWLIEDQPRAAVRMFWWCYASPQDTGARTTRLYRGEIGYEVDEGQSEVPTRTLWVLWDTSHDPQLQAREAAWQQFVRAWLACADLRLASLAEGLDALWNTWQE